MRRTATKGTRAFIGLVCAASALFAVAQEVDPTKRAMEKLDANCGACHDCTSPTPQSRCLRACPRTESLRIEREFTQMRGPRSVILDEIEDVYLPVPFDHEGHADMAAMTDGCAVCHHYTQEGLAHPACKTCHTVRADGADIRMPGLKGAYHRQCMNCHREWSGETGCGACHHAKAGAARTGRAGVMPTADDLIGRMHPPIAAPDEEVYTTEREGYEPTKVLFRHREHVEKYDIRCAECHREDSCARCHTQGRTHVQRTRTLDDHHTPCLSCHRTPNCEKCHFGPEKSPPPPFEHLMTGWPLNEYHQRLSCRACHAKVPFRRQDSDCNACHRAWDPTNFDHGVTGQILDSSHRTADCEVCHPQRDFAKRPSCRECHEADENVEFPSQRPGPVRPRGRSAAE